MATPNFFQGLSGALFPTPPGADPETAQAAQRQALLMAGLGMMSSAQRPGATLGGSLAEGVFGAAQNYSGAMNTAFRNTLVQKQQEREEQAEERRQKEAERKERQSAATTAGRVSTGISSAEDPMAYWQLVSGMPEVQGALQAYDIDPASITSPEQVAAVGQQFAATGAVGAPTTQLKDYTGTQREYALAQTQGYKGSFMDYMRDLKSSASSPSNVQEYEYYNSLPSDEARAEYLRVKRAERGPSSTFEKRLFEVNDAAFKARANVGRYENIANQMLEVMPASGIAAKWTEQYKAITGSEDAVTNLRKDWNNLRVSAAVQNLPPGVASDKDIELVMSAFLPEMANPEAIASFMRGLSKLEALKAEYHEFESDYLSERGNVVGLGAAWRAHVQQKYAGVDEGPAGWSIEPVED